MSKTALVTMGADVPRGFEPLVYLKAAIAKLAYEYFVYLEPTTAFASNPSDLSGALGKSPLHVPLESGLGRISADKMIHAGRIGYYCTKTRLAL